jgi:hypothetical protein
VAALRRAGLAAVVIAAVVVLIVVLTRGSSTRRAHVTPVVKARPGQTAPLQFGANVGRLFNGEIYSSAIIDAQLSALRATGATLARSDAPWEASEPEAPHGGVHHYDWRFDDTVASALAVHGLRWLPIIDYSAPWAQSVPGHDHSPPASASEYAAYAAALAGRYGPGGSFWRSHPALPARPIDTYEIWNEPDSAVFWYPKPDAARYDDLYLRAREAIKAVQPAARVIVGGLADPAMSVPALLAAVPSVAHQLDGVAIHPYGPNPEAVVVNVRSARTALAAAGAGAVPLYVTEFGWTTSPPGALDYLPGRLRPAYIEQTLSSLGHLDCNLAAVLLYAWITPQRVASDSNDWFGIHPPAGGDSADVRAFTQGLRAAAAPAPAIACA